MQPIKSSQICGGTYNILIWVFCMNSSLRIKMVCNTVSSVSAQGPSQKTACRLSNPLIGYDGRVYTCSERNLFAFERNGSISWTVPLNYTCNVGIAPVHGDRGKVRDLAWFASFKSLSLIAVTYSAHIQQMQCPDMMH